MDHHPSAHIILQVGDLPSLQEAVSWIYQQGEHLDNLEAVRISGYRQAGPGTGAGEVREIDLFRDRSGSGPAWRQYAVESRSPGDDEFSFWKLIVGLEVGAWLRRAPRMAGGPWPACMHPQQWEALLWFCHQDTHHALQDTFPDFEDADVQIVITSTRRYRLHSSTLRRSSALFESLITAENAADLTGKAKKRNKIRWRLVLHPQVEPDGHEVYVFALDPINEDGQATGYPRPIQSNENGRVPVILFKVYDMLLGAFYNKDIKLHDSDITAVLDKAFTLVEIAEYVGCVPLISRSVDAALLSEGQTLFRAIANSPIQWIQLANRISSRAIFKEAIIHITGQYNRLIKEPPSASFLQLHPNSRTVLDELNPETREILEEYVNELRQACRNAESSLVTHYPSNLTRQSTTGRADRDDIGRSSYSSDIFQWIALSLFRHWASQSIALDGSKNADDGGYGFYHRINRGGMAYLNRGALLDFHTRFPMTQKATSVLHRHLDELKETAHHIVAPLLVNRSQVDIVQQPIHWLTCIHTKSNRFPWEPKPDANKRRASEAFSDEDDEVEQEAMQRQIPRQRGHTPEDENVEEDQEGSAEEGGFLEGEEAMEDE